MGHGGGALPASSFIIGCVANLFEEVEKRHNRSQDPQVANCINKAQTFYIFTSSLSVRSQDNAINAHI
jgi:hypothetical protein